MGYEGDRRGGRDRYGAGDRDYRRDAYRSERGYDRAGYDRDRGYDRYGSRDPRGYDYEDRGFLDRAGDEVRSWFGDDDAERRRRADERHWREDYEREARAYGRGGGDRGSAYPWYAGVGFDGYGLGIPPSFAPVGPLAYGVQPQDRYGREQGYREPDRGSDRGSRRGEHHDISYRSWRDRQMEAFDRDYDEYRREHQSNFDSDFGTWRQTRQTQRQSLGQVREHQEVVGSDGQHVGKVDHVRDDRILLAKNDKDAGGHHHSIPCSWIVSVADKVTISKTAEEAQRLWRDEEQNSAFWGGGERDRDRPGAEGGPHTLNRSFPGTY